jgi:hypothetical protein
MIWFHFITEQTDLEMCTGHTLISNLYRNSPSPFLLLPILIPFSALCMGTTHFLFSLRLSEDLTLGIKLNTEDRASLSGTAGWIDLR